MTSRSVEVVFTDIFGRPPTPRAKDTPLGKS
jgi:hypothetical protein